MNAKDKQIAGDHYKKMKIQPETFIYENGIGWHEGTAIKYLCRWRDKGGTADLDKAIHIIELLREKQQPEKQQEPQQEFKAGNMIKVVSKEMNNYFDGMHGTVIEVGNGRFPILVELESGDRSNFDPDELQKLPEPQEAPQPDNEIKAGDRVYLANSYGVVIKIDPEQWKGKTHKVRWDDGRLDWYYPKYLRKL